MDRSMDFNGFNGFPPPYMNTDLNNDFPPMESGMFNPINQYEQAYMYYKYMSQMMEYKINCKEYEKLCLNIEKNLKSSEK